MPLRLHEAIISRHGRRLAKPPGLSKLSEKIDHLGRDIFLDHPIVGRSQCASDFVVGAPLATGGRRGRNSVAVGIGLAPAPAVPVILKAQNLLPLAASGAAPRSFGFRLQEQLQPADPASTDARSADPHKGPTRRLKQKTPPIVPPFMRGRGRAPIARAISRDMRFRCGLALGRASFQEARVT